MEFKMKIVEGAATQSTIALEDLQVTSTNGNDYEGQMARQEAREEITSIHPPDKDADIADIFANLWATLNHARRMMIQRHSDQLFQAHNTYINQLRELNSLELTQVQ